MKFIGHGILACCLLLQHTVHKGELTPGEVVSFELEKDGVLFRMRTGVMKLSVCSSSIIHVVYSPDGSIPMEENPMIKQTDWPTSNWKFETASQDLTIATSQLRISVSRKDGSITFEDARGNLLLREGGDDGGKLMVPSTANGEHTYHATAMFFPTSGEGFYGLGQHQAGVWNYNGESVELSQDNSNISIPFFVSTLGYGLFWNNPSVSRFNNRFAHHLYLDSEVANTIDYYFFFGPECDQIIAAYRSLTGEVPLYGKWAYGFWQCKNRYKSQEEILGVAHKYRDLGIPIDNIVQDWYWWTKMGSHEFNANYPDPKAMVEELHKNHFRVMISVWPFFETGTANFNAFDTMGWFLFKNKASASWLPNAALYDAFTPGARQLYWRQIDDSLFRIGFDAWWLDTTEPESLSRREEILMNQVHTGIGSGARYANIFPLMTTTAVYQGQRHETDEKRVFILTRSAAAGMQRNAAAAWSGDIFSTWAALKRQIPAGLNFMLSGVPYWTSDIGGFESGDPTDPGYQELFVRWFEYGTFCPIMRVHGTRSNDQNELWSYGDGTQAILVKYVNFRYRLLPYNYSVAWRVTNEGYTMMRPLVMDFRTDTKVQEIGDQFLFGPSLLVNPVTDSGADSRRLYMPQGTWYDFWTGRKQTGGQFMTALAPLETIPIYVRAGAILPLGPIIQYTGEKPSDPIELRIYAGADGDFVLYEDEGDSYRYENGSRSTIPLHWNDASQTLTIGERSGTYRDMLQRRVFNIIWVSEGHGVGVSIPRQFDKSVDYTGRAVNVSRGPEN